jgi:uncharacterized LabA/DUF88 family protein
MFKPNTPELESLGKKLPERIAYLESVLNEKTIVYLDYANIRGWSKRLGWQIDLKKLKGLFDSFGIIEVHFYFGTYSGDEKSNRFMTFVHKSGYKVHTKPVKIMQLSIDVTSISAKSPDILTNFITDTLLRQLRVETIEYLNEELKNLNKQGLSYLEHPKCNFDVEIGSDMRLHNLLNRAETFCLWSGDSDFADTIKELLLAKRRVSVFGTARGIASELNQLKSSGLEIFDIKKLREFVEKVP